MRAEPFFDKCNEHLDKRLVHAFAILDLQTGLTNVKGFKSYGSRGDRWVVALALVTPYTGTCRWTEYGFWHLCPEQGTVEPRFNEPLFNEVLDIMNDILCPGQSYSKMYGIEPQYNEPRYNKFFDITNIIRKPKRKIYLDITTYNVNTRQKINAEQINSQQIL